MSRWSLLKFWENKSVVLHRNTPKMTLQWTAVALFLYVEIGVLVILCLPFISARRYVALPVVINLRVLNDLFCEQEWSMSVFFAWLKSLIRVWISITVSLQMAKHFPLEDLGQNGAILEQILSHYDHHSYNPFSRWVQPLFSDGFFFPTCFLHYETSAVGDIDVKLQKIMPLCADILFCLFQMLCVK